MAPKEPSADPAGYPVLFWVHGGAFEQGLGNCALYNGTAFALNGIVTVVINYRLGALGFMASESMEGNYGFLDQRKALLWTQENIASFGGDPTKVTVAGQSAGAMSAGAHMVSRKSAGLFSRVVMESNPLALPFHTRESAGKNADSVMEYLSCAVDDVECMRTKSVDEVLDAQAHAVKLNLDTLLVNFLPFAPMVEPGGEIEAQPMDMIRDGQFDPIPILGGTMTDEGQLFVFELFPKALNEAAYKVIIEGVFGTSATRRILEKYPFEIYPGNEDGRNTLNVLATDLLFYCPLRNVSQGYLAAAQAQRKSVEDMQTFVYRFKHVISFDCWGENYTFCVGEVCHGSELPFVFNVFNDGVSVFYDPTAQELALSADLVAAWSNFINSGSPNVGQAIPLAYPVYNPTEDSMIVLEEPGSYVESHFRSAYCDMWDSLGYFY